MLENKKQKYNAILLIEKNNFNYLIKEIFDKTLNNSFNKKNVFIKNNKDLNKIMKLKKIDYLFNFQQKIINVEILNKIRFPINFHPGPTKYPGRGGYVWAIYQKSKYYGCVSHIMKKKVDSGRIIEEARFSIEKFDNVETLKFKSFLTNLRLFYNVLNNLNFKKKISYKNIQWKRKSLKLVDLEKINTFHKNSSKSLKQLIIRATEYYPYGPYMLDGQKKIKFKVRKKTHII
jgi:methionyl-tRNA formyltransferase